MHLTIVRHTRALDTQSWTDDDLLRPLDPHGRRAANGLTELIARHTVRRIVTSPTVRCRQSVQPLASRLGLDIEEWNELGPDGMGATIVTQCFANPDFDDAVLCTHGEVMEPLTRLEDLRRAVRRRDLSRDRLLTKGSAWRLRITNDGKITKFEHLVPRRR